MVLKAAEYADEHNLWDARGRAKVPVTNTNIGTTGSGQPSNVIDVQRNSNNTIHGWPGNPINEMKNITEIIKNAINTNVVWQNNEFYSFIDWLANSKLQVSFDEADNDLWAVVLADSISIAYIWKKSPLMFLRTDYIAHINGHVESGFNYIQIIVVDDLFAPVFCVNLDQQLTDRIRFNFNPKSFSAEDFWFYNQT